MGCGRSILAENVAVFVNNVRPVSVHCVAKVLAGYFFAKNSYGVGRRQAFARPRHCCFGKNIHMKQPGSMKWMMAFEGKLAPCV